MIMIDHKNNKPKEPIDIKMMVKASLAFILFVLAGVAFLAVLAVK